MTNRIALTLALLVALFVALQNCSEYWVMSRLDCPVTTDGTMPYTCEPEPAACADIATAATSCCEESDLSCPMAANSNCTSSCSPIESGAPCPAPGEPPKCCFLVHPLWLEPPTKLPVIPVNLVGFLPEPLVLIAKTELYNQGHLSPPPWGVHPSISSTVLRI